MTPSRPGVPQRDAALPEHGFENLAAPGPARAANLEDVHEVRVELEVDGDLDRRERVIPDPEPVVQRTADEHQRMRQVQGSSRHDDRPGLDQIGIRQIDNDGGVVAAHRRAEQQRTLAAESDRQP
jgi:hypothetical protein